MRRRTRRRSSVVRAEQEQLEQLLNKALAAGDSPTNDPVDQGFMYG
ncbi:MAG: hypothetical protein ACRDZ4_03850 [Egibacteraceae bacterium]